jgi:ATP-dependent Lon protease
MGGDALHVEARAVRGSAGFKQTGQLGKVMIESSEIAYTLARLECGDKSGDCAGFFDRHFVHLHVPAGATPKDGPSAGVTIASALYTLARGKPAKSGWAMTGELDLTGRVLPVGGIREKVIAARRAKLKNVILPEENRGDWQRLPDHLKQGLRVHFAARFADVVKLCL